MSEFKTVEEEENRCKYTVYEKEALINWMCDNLYTRQSPNEKDTTRKRDINSELESCKSMIMEQYRPYSNLSLHTLFAVYCQDDLIKDGFDENGKDKFVLVQKVLITVCARELHLLMVKPEAQGGFAGAHEPDGSINTDGSRRVRFSENTIRHYWPNWLKVMTDADKVVCGCSTCCDTDDVNTAYNGKRRKIVSAAEVDLDEMADNTEEEKRSKAEFQESLDAYKNEIHNADGSHKHERGWSAADQYGCGERVTICGDHYPDQCPDNCAASNELPRFECQKGDCSACKEHGYAAPTFEMNYVDDDEVITYTLFTPHTRCNIHGGHFIQEFSDTPKYR